MLAFGAGELIGQPPVGLQSTLLNGRVFFSQPAAQRPQTLASSPSLTSSPRSTWKSAPLHAPVAPPPVTGPSNASPASALPSSAAPLSPPPSKEAIAAAASALLSADPPGTIADRVMKHSTDNPLEPMLRLISGVALYAAGDFGHSQNELRAALLLDDHLWPAALYRGLCLESMGKPGLARTEYDHVARLLGDPSRTSPCLPGGLHTLETDLLELARLKTTGLSHTAKS